MRAAAKAENLGVLLLYPLPRLLYITGVIGSYSDNILRTNILNRLVQAVCNILTSVAILSRYN